MNASGTFEIQLTPQTDTVFPAGRMTINKKYTGGMVGSGKGQMISKRTQDGPAVYFAVEEFSGEVNGIKGSFTLLHRGYMSKDTKSLEVDIMAGSATGGLEGISGSLAIEQVEQSHAYTLTFEL